MDVVWYGERSCQGEIFANRYDAEIGGAANEIWASWKSRNKVIYDIAKYLRMSRINIVAVFFGFFEDFFIGDFDMCVEFLIAKNKDNYEGIKKRRNNAMR